MPADTSARQFSTFALVQLDVAPTAAETIGTEAQTDTDTPEPGATPTAVPQFTGSSSAMPAGLLPPLAGALLPIGLG